MDIRNSAEEKEKEVKDDKKKRVYYGPTTPQQRRLLIDTYFETKSVKKACQKAKVVSHTFYRWYPRYCEEGYRGLEKEKSKAPIRRRVVEEQYAKRAIELKKEHSEWGRRTIANTIRKEHNWEKVISPTGVRNVLIRAGMWDKITSLKKNLRKV